MHRFIKSLLVLSLLVTTFASAADYRAGEVIVKFKDGFVRNRSEVNTLYHLVGVKSVKRFTGIMDGMEKLTLRDDVSVEEAIMMLERDGAVEFAEPNYIVRILPSDRITALPAATPPPGSPGEGLPCIPGIEIPGCDPTKCILPGIPFPPGCTDQGGGTPNPGPNPPPPANRPPVANAPADVDPPVVDPNLSQAYGLAKVGAVEAWKSHRGSKDMVVAVIDTGVDYNHEDLSFNMWRNPNPTKGDLVGWDAIHHDGLPFDDQGHGTHTAGTVGAVGGNGKGVSGVSQRVSIMAVKFLSAQGSGDIAGAIEGIDYAVSNGARILSNSWGGTDQEEGIQALQEAIVRARDANVLFVAAAGNGDMFGRGINNDTSSQRSYPASYEVENMVSVAATDSADRLASFSNYGVKTTHVAAPGVNVYSTMPSNRYKANSGTSMACPHVAGAAALIWSKDPSMTYAQVKRILMDSTDKLPVLNGKVATGGRINVLNALRSME